MWLHFALDSSPYSRVTLEVSSICQVKGHCRAAAISLMCSAFELLHIAGVPCLLCMMGILQTSYAILMSCNAGYDMEDAMILNKSAVERGLGHATMHKTEQIDLSKESGERLAALLVGSAIIDQVFVTSHCIPARQLAPGLYATPPRHSPLQTFLCCSRCPQLFLPPQLHCLPAIKLFDV